MGWLKKIKKALTIKNIAKIAAPVVGFALGGPYGAAIGGGLAGGNFGGKGFKLKNMLGGAALGYVGGQAAQFGGLAGGQGFKALGSSLGNFTPAAALEGTKAWGINSISKLPFGGKILQASGLLGGGKLSDLAKLGGGGGEGGGEGGGGWSDFLGAAVPSALNYEGAKQGYEAMRTGTNEANTMLQGGLDKDTAAYSPYEQGGLESFNKMREFDNEQDPTGQQLLDEDPGYKFRMDEGTKALEGSAAARGGLLSGAALKEMGRYSQGLASQEYDAASGRRRQKRMDRWGRLSDLTGIGTSARDQLSRSRSGYTNSMAGNRLDLGNAEAASKMGQLGAIGRGISDYDELRRMR